MVYYSNTPLDKVRVELVQGEVTNPPLKTTFTSNGHYHFSFVVLGSYLVKAYAPNPMYISWKASSIEVVYDDVARDIHLPKLMTLLSPGDGADVASLHPTLTWEANPEAAYYWVQVNVMGTWELVEFEESVSTEHTISALLSPGVEYTWQIDAYDSQHRHVGTTQTIYSFTVAVKWEKTVKVIPDGILPGSEIGAKVSYNWFRIDEQGRDVFQIYNIEGWSHYFVGAYRISIESKSGTLWSILIPATPLRMTYYPEQLYVHADDWISVKAYGITEKEALGLYSIAAQMAGGLPVMPPGGLPFFVGHNEDYLAPPYIDTSGFPPIAEEGEVYSMIVGCLCSPGELRIYDTESRVTGFVNGEVREEIPNSAYFNGILVILSPNESYRYEVVGTEEKQYKLGVISVEPEEANAFTATDIPTASGTIHQYTIDWDILSENKEGAIIKIDSDGDGTFEKTFTANSELTYDEFMLQTATTLDVDPYTLNLDSEGKWVTVYIELPEGYDVSNIDTESIELATEVVILTNEVEVEEFMVHIASGAPTAIGDYDDDGIPDLMVKFDRAELVEYLGKAELDSVDGLKFYDVMLTVTGALTDGTPFLGSDTIKVIKK